MSRSLIVTMIAVALCALDASATMRPQAGGGWSPPLNPMPSATKAQYAEFPSYSVLPGRRIDPAKLYSGLKETHTNTYNALLLDWDGVDYLNLVSFLNETQHDPDMKVWVTLIPPNAHYAHSCSVPADSPFTSWNETMLFNRSMGLDGCQDYVAWARNLGMLGTQYPHLVAVNIDDFTEYVPWAFDAQKLREIRYYLNAGGVRFWPTFYYPTFMAQKDILLGATDGILFYFRNDKEGQAQCRVASCDPLATCVMPCLYHNCANISLPNLPSEIASFSEVVRNSTYNTPIVVGVYFSAYHSCPGGPSIYYDYSVLKEALASSMTVGAMVYTSQFFSGSTTCNNTLAIPESKVCAVKRNFE